MNSVRRGTRGDGDAVFELCKGFATSFTPERGAFDRAFERLVEDEDARLLVATANDQVVGYLLGFDHPTLFANGPVAIVEEVVVDSENRRKGVARALMAVFESWAAGRGCRYVSVATRRAAGFYESLGYEESAAFYRKMLAPKE